MAKISHVTYQAFEATVEPGGVSWQRIGSDRAERSGIAQTLPLIFQRTGEPWVAANLWLVEKHKLVANGDLSALSLAHNAWCLCSYLAFLEQTGAVWNHQPERKSDHPAVRYRRHLIRARDERRLAPSTTSARIACVANFYTWAHHEGILSYNPSQETTHRFITRGNEYGIIGQKIVTTSDLHIKRKRSHPLPSIGGLSPVSDETRRDILNLAEKHCSQEFALMLNLGFATGMRLRTILDLKTQTLDRAIRGEVQGISYLQVGPRYNVATKFSVNGHAIIPTALIEQLQAYVVSLRRARRTTKALPENQTLVFLNRFGKPYGLREKSRSPSINVDMLRLRAAAKSEGIDLSGFYFHCTRATFGTSIVLAGLRTKGVSLESILSRLTELLMHRDEATSLRYVKYVESTKLIATHEASYASWLFGGTGHDNS